VSRESRAESGRYDDESVPVPSNIFATSLSPLSSRREEGMGMSRRKSGFTLLELLIVIAIIAVLSSLLIPVIASAIRSARRATCASQIANIKAALVSYSSDTGSFPRRPGPIGTRDALFKNDIAYAYAALMNNRLRQVGGGPNANYLERRHEMIALAAANDIDNNGFMSVNPADNAETIWLSPLPSGDRDLVNDTSYQVQHLPGSASELVLVDPWGNPYVYREWASVPRNVKDGLSIRRTYLLRAIGSLETTVDRPHDPNGFDIISCGPNGIFEYGAGDDVCSWQGVK
jgi:prepilin-type N-terminal cleavage/methylation domain-containing protein